MKKLLIALLAAAVIIISAIPAFAVTNPPAAKDSTATAETVINKEANAFKEQFKERQNERKGLVAEAKSLWEQVKAANTSIKELAGKIKEGFKSMDKAQRKEAVQEFKNTIQPSRDQAKALHTDIKSLRGQKKVEWNNYKTAVKAKDSEKASTALDNIISYRKAINEKVKQLLGVKQNTLNILSGYAQ